MPPTASLILLLAGIIFLSARLYASPHSRGGGQVGGLTFEAEPVRRHQPIALVVTSVEDGGPAAKADIAAGDRIDRIDGRPIASAADAAARLRRDARKGVTLRIRRGIRTSYKHLPATRGPQPGTVHVAENIARRR